MDRSPDGTPDYRFDPLQAAEEELSALPCRLFLGTSEHTREISCELGGCSGGIQDANHRRGERRCDLYQTQFELRLGESELHPCLIGAWLPGQLRDGHSQLGEAYEFLPRNLVDDVFGNLAILEDRDGGNLRR